jgi:membrane fusion protein (multidrug efflux system)
MAEEELRQAEERYRQAQANLARRKISQEDVRTAAASVRQAEAALAQARAGLAQKKLTRDDIENARAAVAQAEADVTYDRRQLQDSRIVSPVAGVVVTRSVNPGEAVGTSDTLLRVVAEGSVYFEGDVPERDLPLLTPGQSVTVTVDALPGRRFRGTLRQLIPVAQEGSRAFRARVLIADPGRTLPVGGFARGEVLVSRKRDALVVPREALRGEAGDAFVYLARDGKARRQPVVTGLTDAEHAEIVAGLQAGDPVISRGAASVRDGASVKVVE